MSLSHPHLNRRILAVDDNPAIHEDFRKILTRTDAPDNRLDDLESAFLEAQSQPHVHAGFEVDSAYQGEEALAKVVHAFDHGDPYALAFVDMRMPPGWDGVETVSRLWKADPHLQIVICTAYSDYSWQEILHRLGNRDNLAVLKKPFDNIEVVQLCETLTQKWSLRLQEVTERKRSEAEKAKLESQLHQAQRMESVGQLAGGVAHDFNNVLAAMMMRLSLLQSNPTLDSETRETLDELMHDAKRAASMTRQLLLFSRRSVMELHLLDLNELVSTLLKMLGRLIGEHIVVRFERRDGLPALQADRGMIEQVIMNLAVNARDAMQKGGEITIRIEDLEVDAARVLPYPQVQPGRFLCLSVADTGCGMDDATRGRIFEPFFTTKETGKGTGLGLATVHGIVAQHKGWVEVESEFGKGATFHVFLPASSMQIPQAASAAEAAPIKGHETILVVEDEVGLRRLVAEGLRRLGYSVYEAANGQAAIRIWQERPAQFDLLFSDMVMPEGLTGLDLAEKLKKEKPGLKVVISSGYSAEMAANGRSAIDGITYLQKPYQLEPLSRVVRDCLDGKK